MVGQAAYTNEATLTLGEISQLTALFNAGNYVEMEAHAHLLVEQYPNSGFAWKALGVSLNMQGKEALYASQKTVELLPHDAEAHNNLGNVLKDIGQLEESAASYRKALKTEPNFAVAHCNLAAVLQKLGQLDESAVSCLRTLEIKPDFAEAHLNLGNTLLDLGQLEESVVSFRLALEIMPDYSEAHNNLGNALRDLGQLDEAIACYRRALEIKPDYAVAHSNLGNTLLGLGQLDEAIACYRRALEIKPDYAEAHLNLGAALQEFGQLDIAVASFRRALEIKPDYAEAHSNLGVTLKQLGQLEIAVASFRRALEIRPDYAEAHSNLGNALLDLGQLDNAIACYRRALEINPDYAVAHSNLGNALKDLGQLDDAIASYRRALQIKPEYTEAHSNLLFTLNYHPDLNAEDIFRAYQEYDAARCHSLRPDWRAHDNDKNPARRLRIGYVSPDFRYHSCASFLEPLLAHHDKTQVEVYAYAELHKKDDVSARYQSYVDHWILTKGMSDEALAERIRSDRIDILVELSGHTANNRLLVFARKPAQISVSWLGYGYTTGLSAIDYYLTDEVCVPTDAEKLFAERPWRIATPAFVYRPNAGMDEVNSLPAFQRGHITFGTLTRSVRINHRTIRVWSEILKAVPNSRLIIDSFNFKEPAMQERMAARFAEHGIDHERLEMGYHSPPWDILHGTDIGLDCFPHNSGTTLFETLYMGVPFITLAGRPSVGRLGGSILHGVGHPEWIAESEDEYVAKAIELASDLAKLSRIRIGLRGEMQASPLMDEAGFTCRVEEAYREMWQK